jgi:SAM-dependent methyltransferase
MTAEDTPGDAPLLGLPASAFDRVDETPDPLFYAFPRLVTHIDDRAIAAVTQLYRGLFPAGGAILDLMSSWVSHLPPEVEYGRVVGLGLNRDELAANPRLDERVVQDLNQRPELPFGDAEFDGAAICVSIQYLRRPVTVLRETARVLRVGAPLALTFSNRCFPTKAVEVWRSLGDAGHLRLVESYLRAAGGWSPIDCLEPRARGEPGDPLFAVVARRGTDNRRRDAP